MSLESEVGGACVFDSPWAAAPKVTDSAGAAVVTTAVSAGVYSFASKAGMNYTISSK